MHVDQRLVDAAMDQATSRFPTVDAGAAALYTEDGQIITSVCFDGPNEVVNLCHETGAICEANRRNVRIVASVCVSRSGPDAPFVILTPCGVCQERLAVWGLEFEVAVPLAENPTRWEAKTLRQVQPHYWRNILNGDAT